MFASLRARKYDANVLIKGFQLSTMVCGRSHGMLAARPMLRCLLSIDTNHILKNCFADDSKSKQLSNNLNRPKHNIIRNNVMKREKLDIAIKGIREKEQNKINVTLNDYDSILDICKEVRCGVTAVMVL